MIEKAISSFAESLGSYYWQIFYSCMICWAIEVFWARSTCSLASRLNAAKIWLMNGVIIIFVMWVVMHIVRVLNIPPLITLNLSSFSNSNLLWLRVGTLVLAPITASIIGDFFAYWLHRALHTIPLLWRIHRLHHSVRELSTTTSIAHFLEGSLQTPFVLLPLAWLIHPVVEYAPALTMILLGMSGPFQHACTRLHLGPLRYVFADNRYHRIHHSIDPKHHNKNFANFTTLWDQLFGTAYFPATDEWPDTGLAECLQPKTLRDHALFPFLPQEHSVPVSQAADA